MDWIRDHLWETWLIAAASLGVLELVSLDMVFIMLAGGALVGALTALVGAPAPLTLVLALATAMGLLALLRPNVVRSMHRGPDLRTGAAALVGNRATVVRELGPGASGRVKIGGEEWTALPYDETERMQPGDIVDVVQIKGATAYVLRVEKLES